jgi:hypothetical protein
LKNRLAKLKPLTAPKKLVRRDAEAVGLSTPEMSEKRDISKEETASIDDVSKRVVQLRQKIGEALVSKDIVDLSSRCLPYKNLQALVNRYTHLIYC